ncbi:MAG TPA: copper chaperone PCu(A)C [Burkholderiaceae bacterium]|nr:copper chaperone PCu(A)C [Burkholderiaceae bacterium]
MENRTMTLYPTLARTAAAALLAIAAGAQAQTTIKEAWVRGTVAQQKASGAFMQITSAQGGKLLSVTSPVAGVAEIHEMAMQGDTMRMRAVPALELPAGKAVELKPGGYHLMLMDLKQQLKAGATVPLTLVVEGKDGKRETVAVQAVVKALGDAGHDMKKH